MSDDKLSEHFHRRELECRCGCGLVPTPEFVKWLEGLRGAYGYPMIITSGARCEAHNRSIGGAADSMHLQGLAVDVRVYGERALLLIGRAFLWGVRGVGVKQHGPMTERFVHLDLRETPIVYSYP